VTKSLGPKEASCRIYTQKEGLLSAVAHDLELECQNFRIELDEGSGQVEAHFEAPSLKVVTALVNGHSSPVLSASDRQKIEHNLQKDVLHTDRHPKIHFRSSQVVGEGDRRTITGMLELHGRSRSLSLVAERVGPHWQTKVQLHQPDFGIVPYSAMFGALKIKPEVWVVLRVLAQT
jgi:polyisoprenoid-binding protein YceI